MKKFWKPESNRLFFSRTALRVILLPSIILILTATRFVSTEKSISVEELISDRKLQSETDALLPLFDNMPPVPVYLRDEPIVKSGTNTERGVAYTNCGKNELPAIFVKRVFYEKTNQKQLTNILKHELTHAWLCRQNFMNGHDDNFRRKFAEVGGFGN
jgi:hypothetical protein